ncbi:MAG: DUF202 domain-containing protein [Puia sp.]|nr:DUF202 domain-containing protein [Puia sp.]
MDNKESGEHKISGGHTPPGGNKESGPGEVKRPGLEGSLSDHLANERTFLAWVRTSIGIMAFGFVVVKFTLFVKQLSLVLQKPILPPTRGYSSILGISLVAFGALIGFLAFLRYKKTDRLLADASYRPSTLLSTLLTICILLIGILLVVYLLASI